MTAANTNTATKADAVGQQVVDTFNEVKSEVAAQVQRAAARRRKPDDGASHDDELVALAGCARALEGLSDDARSRVLLYLARRYEPRPTINAVPPVHSDPYPKFGASDNGTGDE